MKRDPFSLDGRVAVVTGATGLLGRQHCRALAEAGAHVVAVDLDDTACQELAAALSASGLPAAMGAAADITDEASLTALARRVDARFGRLDVLVNNAAIDDKLESPELQADLSRFERHPVSVFRRSLEVNVTGTFLACQVLGTVLAERRSGSIVNVASTYGLVAPDQSLYRTPDGAQRFFKSPGYPTSKGAVLSFTRYLAAYWGHRNVRVNALCPGGVANGQEDFFVERYSQKTPLGRMASRDDYRGAVVFLASDASAYMTGASLVVDGGFTAW